jgi:hypothetical protein
MQIRKARLADIAEIETMIARSVMELMGQEYSLEQRRASIGPLFGVDRQIVEDGTYYVVEHAGRLAGVFGAHCSAVMASRTATIPASIPISIPRTYALSSSTPVRPVPGSARKSCCEARPPRRRKGSRAMT